MMNAMTSLGSDLGAPVELVCQLAGFALGLALGYWVGNGHGHHG